jgi:hypothetical protein
MWITLPHAANRQFHITSLVRELIQRQQSQIVIGHQTDNLAEHNKTYSLDYWIRTQIVPEYQNTMQAVTGVINQICETGLFEQIQAIDPNTKRQCGYISLINHPVQRI